jgi:hypothetical protein
LYKKKCYFRCGFIHGRNGKNIRAGIEEGLSFDTCYIEAYTPTHGAAKKVTSRRSLAPKE